MKTIEEGIEWYRTFDPKIPEEILPIMARWNWGNLATLTKKQIKMKMKAHNKLKQHLTSQRTKKRRGNNQN